MRQFVRIRIIIEKNLDKMQLCAKFCYGPFEGEKFHLQLQKKAEYSNYGNTGCRVFKQGVQN
jgi:hypothetical protein